MLKRIIFGCALIGVGSVLKAISGEGDVPQAEKNIALVETGNAAIETARNNARMELPKFLERQERDGRTWDMSSLKINLQRGDVGEHIWLSKFEHVEGDKFVGTLSNQPVMLEGLNAGDQVTFHYEDIDDWAFVDRGVGYGFYSVRALMPQMAPEEAAQMAALLSPDLVPKNW